MEVPYRPSLTLHEVGGHCRLSLAGLAHGQGPTLQEAADDLIVRLQRLVLSLRGSGGMRFCGDIGAPDVRILDYLWQLGELAERGQDIRLAVLGPPPADAAA